MFRGNVGKGAARPPATTFQGGKGGARPPATSFQARPNTPPKPAIGGIRPGAIRPVVTPGQRAASAGPTIRPQGSIRPAVGIQRSASAGAVRPPATVRPVTPAGKGAVNPAFRSVPGKGPQQPSVAPRGVPPASVRPATPQPGLQRPGAALAAGLAKKPVVAAPAAAAAAAGKETPKLTVTTQYKSDDIGIQTLVGDYVDRGTNHGKRYYQKVQKIVGHEDIKVFLYWWDTRDGADFSGWWFGDQVGGTEVWARCPTASAAPPRVGWKVPWDSPTSKPGLLFVDPYKGPVQPAAAPPATVAKGATGKGATPSPAAATAAAGAAGAAATQAKVKQATQKVELAEKAANAVINRAKTTLATGKATDAQLKELQQTLIKQQASLNEAQTSLTKDITEVRKGGVSATPSVTELSKLSPRLRTVQAGATEQLNKVKAAVAKAAAAPPVQTAAQKEADKKKEEKDTKDLDETLPAMKELTSVCEESVGSLISLAEPLVAEPPAEEDLNKAMEDVEALFKDSQDKITEARKQITQKLQSARLYAPETRKTALASFSELQTKLTEAQKKLLPFKNFKKDFKSKVDAKKALAELADKLSASELEVEKASMMAINAESGQMAEDEVASTEKVIQAAQAALTATVRTIESKQHGATQAIKDELTMLKDRGSGLQKKTMEMMNTMRVQRAGITAKVIIEQASEKVVSAEKAMDVCQDAEMPFLKGIEVLPKDESDKALKESEEAAVKTEAAVNQVRIFIKTKLNTEVKKFAKEAAEKATKELSQISTRVEAVAKKLADFKKETMERKVNAIMAEVIEVINAAEAKSKAYAEVTKVFSDDLETVTPEALKAALEKAGEAEKEATAATAEARKQLTLKQKDAKGGDAALQLAKLNGRLSAAQNEIGKNKKAASNGEKLIKGKDVIAEQGKLLEKASAEVEKVEKASIPLEAGGELNDEELQQVGDNLVTAQKLMKEVSKSLEVQVAAAAQIPSLKAALQKLVEKAKKGQESLDKAMGGSKEMREKVLAGAYVREGKRKTEEVEAAIEKVNDAELPFLKGIEVLPLTEATATIAASETASQALHVAITEARTFIAQKNIEMKQFAQDKVKPMMEELAGFSTRINTAATKLGQFRKDTDGRRKTAQMQEASEKIGTVEKEVAQVAETVAPLGKEDAAEMSAEKAKEICEKASEMAKSAQASLDSIRKILTSRQADAKTNPSLAETLKKLQVRVTETSTELAKARKVSSDHEHKFVAKKLLAECGELVESLEAEVKKAEEACAPLLEQGGDKFLVNTSLATLTAALRKHMAEKSLDIAGLFKEANGGKASGKISMDAFKSYLEKLPEAIGAPEVAFTEERRASLGKLVDTDSDGAIGQDEFKAMFKQTFVCIQGITMTDGLKVGDSKTVGKIEPKEVLEALGEVTKDDSTGLERVEVKSITTDKKGFVTMKGNQSTMYLKVHSEYQDFLVEMDKKVEERVQNVRKVISVLNSKSSELSAHGNSGPLAEAKVELGKLRPKATAHQVALEQLKKKVIAGKSEFVKKEIAEKNAHIEAKERAEADAITGAAKKEFESVEALAKKVEESAGSLTTLKGEELQAFATPASVAEVVDKLVPEVAAATAKAKAAIKEAQPKVLKAAKGPMLEAKKELGAMLVKVETAQKKCVMAQQAVKRSCAQIVESSIPKASQALRDEVQKKSTTVEKLFTELAAGKDRIDEDVLAKRLQSLEGLELTAEKAKLLCKHIEVGGVGKRSFSAFVQRYYSVVSAIAITSEFDITKAKTLRKAEAEEIIEVLEGPTTDEKLKVTRVRGKSLADGSEGWISLKGNQGTPFLKEVEKPFYTVSGTTEVSLDTDLKIVGTTKVRSLKPGEVMELCEGPQKETIPPGRKAKVKAVSDNAVGWVTIRDREGNVFAEAEEKLYSCVSSVAMTDNLDIKNCNVVKKLTVGELFTVEEGPEEDKDSGITRVKGKTQKDEKVGWITIKGNAGTVYAQASTKHFTVVKEVPMLKANAPNAAEQRKLEVGENLQVVEGPKDEVFPPAIRVKVRAISDGATGWVTVSPLSVKRWTAVYKCSMATRMTAEPTEGAEVLRDIAIGEVLQLEDGPRQEGGDLKMRAKARKDGISGWVTITNSEGKRFMSS